MADPAAPYPWGAQLRAERRVGELLAAIERSAGGRGKTGATLARVLDELGKTKGKRWQRIADLRLDHFEGYIAKTWGEERRIEARVGELLGDKRPGQRTDLQPSTHASKSPLVDWERRDFRQIADLVRRGLLRYDDDAEDSHG